MNSKTQWVMDTLSTHYKSLGLDFNIMMNDEEDSRVEVAVFFKQDGEDMVMPYYIPQDMIEDETLDDLLSFRMEEDKRMFGGSDEQA